MDVTKVKTITAAQRALMEQVGSPAYSMSKAALNGPTGGFFRDRRAIEW